MEFFKISTPFIIDKETQFIKLKVIPNETITFTFFVTSSPIKTKCYIEMNINEKINIKSKNKNYLINLNPFENFYFKENEYNNYKI